jgi:hypothetical protein
MKTNDTGSAGSDIAQQRKGRESGSAQQGNHTGQQARR